MRTSRPEFSLAPGKTAQSIALGENTNSLSIIKDTLATSHQNKKLKTKITHIPAGRHLSILGEEIY